MFFRPHNSFSGKGTQVAGGDHARTDSTAPALKPSWANRSRRTSPLGPPQVGKHSESVQSSRQKCSHLQHPARARALASGPRTYLAQYHLQRMQFLARLATISCLNHFLAVTLDAFSVNVREASGESSADLGSPSSPSLGARSTEGSVITTDRQGLSQSLPGARGWDLGYPERK